MNKKRNISIWNIVFNFVYQLKKAKVNNMPWISSILEFPDYFTTIRKNKTNLELCLPWITFNSFKFLKSFKFEDKKVFEFGSGGSTLFFINNGANIISVEHNREWYDLVISKILNNKKSNLKLITPILSENPKVVSIYDDSYSGYDFQEYADYILSFPDNYFDLVVIDGRARSFCLINSIVKVKNGGYILFDNSNRPFYQVELEEISDWLILKSYGPTINDLSFNETSIFQKPF
jgi:hypothetical protein